MRVDVWALGVMLYQLLHGGQTPVGHYAERGGAPEVLLALASETVNREAMDFDAREMWTAERTRLLRGSEGGGMETRDQQRRDLPGSATTAGPSCNNNGGGIFRDQQQRDLPTTGPTTTSVGSCNNNGIFQQRDQRDLSTTTGSTTTGSTTTVETRDGLLITPVETVHALVASWVGSEFLVRLCKRCLAFDVQNRIDASDLRIWIDRAVDVQNRVRARRSELVQAAFNIDSSRDQHPEASVDIQVVDTEVARIGEKIGAGLFPEVWEDGGGGENPSARASLGSPTSVETSPAGQGSSSSPRMLWPTNSTLGEQRHRVGEFGIEMADLAAVHRGRKADFRDRRRQGCFRRVFLLILVSVIGGGVVSFLIVGALLIHGSWSGRGDNGDSFPVSKVDPAFPLPPGGSPSSNPGGDGINADEIPSTVSPASFSPPASPSAPASRPSGASSPASPRSSSAVAALLPSSSKFIPPSSHTPQPKERATLASVASSSSPPCRPTSGASTFLAYIDHQGRLLACPPPSGAPSATAPPTFLSPSSPQSLSEQSSHTAPKLEANFSWDVLRADVLQQISLGHLKMSSRPYIASDGHLLTSDPWSTILDLPDSVLSSHPHSVADLFWDDEEIVLASIKHHGGMELEFVSPRLQDRLGVVEEAVRKNGLALQFASPRLRGEKGVVDVAFASNPDAAQYVNWESSGAGGGEDRAETQLDDKTTRIVDDKGIVSAAIRNSPDVYGLLTSDTFKSSSLRSSQSVVGLAMQRDKTRPAAIFGDFASESLKADKQFVLGIMNDIAIADAELLPEGLGPMDIFKHVDPLLKCDADVVLSVLLIEGCNEKFAVGRRDQKPDAIKNCGEVRADIKEVMVKAGMEPAEADRIIGGDIGEDISRKELPEVLNGALE